MLRIPVCVALTLAWLPLTAPLPGGLLAAGDWPQWRGPSRNGISSESGLLDKWPDQGPRVLWRTPLGVGYSGLAIADGRVYTLYSDAKGEYAVCHDGESGKRLWRRRLDSPFSNRWGDGPRTTPTVEGKRVYVLGAKGKLAALNAADGMPIWLHDLVADWGGAVPDLGYSNSPLVEGDYLIVSLGPGPDTAFAAFDKDTGELAWKAHSDHPGYSSPIAVDIAGRRQIVFFAGTSATSLEPSQGGMLWRFPWPNSANENVATPIFQPPDRIFLSAAHRGGARMLRVVAAGEGQRVETVWNSRVMKNHFSSSVLYQGHIYGTDRSILKCIDPDNGEMRWRTRGFGEGSLIAAEGNLYVLGTQGRLALVEATPEAFRQTSSFQAMRGKCFTPPSLAQGRIYLRNNAEMVCLDLTSPTRSGR